MSQKSPPLIFRINLKNLPIITFGTQQSEET